MDQQLVKRFIEEVERNQTFQADITASTKFILQQVAKIPTVIGKDFNEGSALLKEIISGRASENEDGTIRLKIPSFPEDGPVRSFDIDPNKVATPKKIAEMEKALRDEWFERGREFQTQRTLYNIFERLSKLASASADTGMIFYFMKLINPFSALIQGEAATTDNISGVPSIIREFYNGALDSYEPALGDIDSCIRKRFAEAGWNRYERYKSVLVDYGLFFIDVTYRSNMDAAKVVLPVGGVSFEQAFEPIAEDIKSGTEERPMSVTSFLVLAKNKTTPDYSKEATIG